ncbi:MAG: enoyl-CoA hydratase [Chloroflexi bacterium CFX7]|nr:enoyl-CoA hydratase [Chloroflexi bacterium CFX7]RIL03664.1 MAG: enoyl-CoA hydratase [bacterium]
MARPPTGKENEMTDVLIEKRPDGVALITLNRPESLNAMGGRLIPMLGEYLAECESDRGVRSIAITGAGRAFCAGGDVKGMQARNEGGSGDGERPRDNFAAAFEVLVRDLRAAQDAVSLKLHTIGKPTVALVNGHAVGAGMSVALACDLRICSDRAKFGTAFRNVGLSGDFGGSYFLQRLVGAGVARELYFTGEILDATRALELGIANRVVPGERLMEEGLAFCAKLAQGPTATYARMKANLNLAESSTLKELLDQEAMLMRLSGMSSDSREAVRAFVEKREPRFIGE